MTTEITQNMLEAPLKVVIVGHVDHGKSTLIGRLLHDTDSLPEGKAEEIIKICARRGVPVEWSFALDAFQAERDQAVTIDTTQIWFRSAKRPYVIIDAPGHREFLKNMLSGAAQADAGVLVVDAKEGLREQTRRHGYLLHLLGLRQVTVIINKMDLVDFDQDRFLSLAEDVRRYLEDLGIPPKAILPLAARTGANMVDPAAEMPWYDGPSLLDALDQLSPLAPQMDRPLRFPVQDIYREETERVLVGRIESGILRVGDEVVISPSNRVSHIREIRVWPEQKAPVEARAGQSIGLVLTDPIFVERGDVLSHEDHAPMLTTVFRASLFWLGAKPMQIGQSLKLKLGSSESIVTVQGIERVIDTEDLKGAAAQEVQRHDVAEVTLRSRAMLAVDEHVHDPRLGRFVLVDGYDTVAAGVISMQGYPDLRHSLQQKSTNIHEVDHLIDAHARALRNGHKGGVFWFTGLSASGKSTLAMRVEKRLFQKGLHCYVLDGDNVRHGLNADLGFAPEDRTENIRRIGEVAALMADSGSLVLTAFISPYRADRERARAAAPHAFHEIYIKADLETCARRDPKGLYKRAKTGEIKEFTGISAPYEAPDQPDLVVDTTEHDIESCVEQILTYITKISTLNESDARSWKPEERTAVTAKS